MKIPTMLPKLTGTEKQIAWAETIRDAMIKYIDAEDVKAGLMNHCIGKPARMKALGEWVEKNGRISNVWIESMVERTIWDIRNSPWFINNRFDRQALHCLVMEMIERELGIE